MSCGFLTFGTAFLSLGGSFRRLPVPMVVTACMATIPIRGLLSSSSGHGPRLLRTLVRPRRPLGSGARLAAEGAVNIAQQQPTRNQEHAMQHREYA